MIPRFLVLFWSGDPLTTEMTYRRAFTAYERAFSKLFEHSAAKKKKKKKKEVG